MLTVFIWVWVFLISLFVLIKASRYFTDSAEKIGKWMGLPTFIIGVTIVAIGSSFPELALSVIAVLKGNSEIVVGNVLGSNIANIFLVLGIAAIIGKKLEIKHQLTNVDLPLLVGASFLLAVTIWNGVYTYVEAGLSLFCLGVYLAYTSTQQKKKSTEKEIKKEMRGELRKPAFDRKTVFILIISLFFIYLAAKFTIDSVIELSELLNIGAEIIAVTAIALGTSLPELAISITAVLTNKPGIAVGNILGSTIFNSLGVMGIAALFGTLVIGQELLLFALPMMLIGVLLYYFITENRIITRWEGWLLVIFYGFFIAKIFNLV